MAESRREPLHPQDEMVVQPWVERQALELNSRRAAIMRQQKEFPLAFLSKFDPLECLDSWLKESEQSDAPPRTFFVPAVTPKEVDKDPKKDPKFETDRIKKHYHEQAVKKVVADLNTFWASGYRFTSEYYLWIDYPKKETIEYFVKYFYCASASVKLCEEAACSLHSELIKLDEFTLKELLGKKDQIILLNEANYDNHHSLVDALSPFANDTAKRNAGIVERAIPSMSNSHDEQKAENTKAPVALVVPVVVPDKAATAVVLSRLENEIKNQAPVAAASNAEPTYDTTEEYKRLMDELESKTANPHLFNALKSSIQKASNKTKAHIDLYIKRYDEINKVRRFIDELLLWLGDSMLFPLGGRFVGKADHLKDKLILEEILNHYKKVFQFNDKGILRDVLLNNDILDSIKLLLLHQIRQFITVLIQKGSVRYGRSLWRFSGLGAEEFVGLAFPLVEKDQAKNEVAVQDKAAEESMNVERIQLFNKILRLHNPYSPPSPAGLGLLAGSQHDANNKGKVEKLTSGLANLGVL